MSSAPSPESSDPRRAPERRPPAPWWVIMLSLTIATGAYVLLVLVGKQDGAATAGSLAALLTGVLAALSALGREK
ncbi:hypothetical protein ACFV1A_09565 [Streptomyces seoulensis]|uniref:hypothetical protein n=1 Tax=Streptomyces seoulensis TaxID=73044 RepID=UPI00103D179A|nr:hypothetical protein [Streptomyces seoulensis]